jgi:hypothetical protein
MASQLKPIHPPVYRPQPLASQLKPATPPVYRPQPLASQLKPAAPPVYRPQPLASQLRPAAPPVFQQSSAGPGVAQANRRVTLTIQLGGAQSSFVPRTNFPTLAIGPSSPKSAVVQRVSVTIVPATPDESKTVIGKLVFNNRPPVNKGVEEEVKKLNRKGDSKWQVGHKVGWDLISPNYAALFVGKSIGDLDDYFKKQGYGSKPTIKMIEACIGVWIDGDYKKTYENNEFAQEAQANMSSGGTVSHLKAQYQSDYDMGVTSASSKKHEKLKYQYVTSQVNVPEKMEGSRLQIRPES